MLVYGGKEYPNTGTAILVATFNGEKYLREQLDSLVVQTTQNFICFLHDDVSSDRTVEIVEEYCERYPEKFVYLGSQKCGGAKQNFFYMLGLVDADYILFCDQDDVWLPMKIERCLSEMHNLEKVYGKDAPLCVYSDLMAVDEKMNTMEDSLWGEFGNKNKTLDLMKNNVLKGCVMMINSDLRAEMLKFKNLDNISMHDWWGGLVCSLLGEMTYIPESLVLYRQHADNVIGAQLEKNYSKKIKNLFSLRKWIKGKQEWINRRRRYALELLELIPEDHPQYVFLKQLANIGEKNKIARLRFYFKNDLIIQTSSLLYQLMFI